MLLDRDFSAGVRLQLCVELVVLLHAGFPRRVRRDAGTEFLKMYANPLEGQTASAIRTLNSRQY